jgi:AcrR family transcriptional regulator
MFPEHPYSSGTRVRILEAALLQFAANGYAGTGIREITARAGVNSSLVNYHFGGKAGLYREVLRYTLGRKGCRLSELAGQLPREAELSRPEATLRLKEYIRVLVESTLPEGTAGPLDEAAMTLLGREMEAPTPEFAALLGDFVQPIAAYLDRIVRALRPDLDEAGRFAMGLSVQGQMLHLRNALGVVRLLRGEPAWPRDLDALVRHFTGFSLRGLGLAEAPGDSAPAFLPIS